MGIDPMNKISIIIRIIFAVTLFQQAPIERLATGVFEEVIVAVKFKASPIVDLKKAISQVGHRDI
jgi:hypothetical protein